MPNGVLPPGYRAQLLGSATSIGGLDFLAPLEESVSEGGLMLMRLDFARLPSNETLSELSQKLSQEGVPAWPGYSHIIAVDAEQVSVYLGWVKGMAWASIIVGILLLMVLPALLGGLIWWLLPESVKSMIEMMVMMGIVFLMMKMMTPMLRSGDKEKKKQ